MYFNLLAQKNNIRPKILIHLLGVKQNYKGFKKINT